MPLIQSPRLDSVIHSRLCFEPPASAVLPRGNCVLSYIRACFPTSKVAMGYSSVPGLTSSQRNMFNQVITTAD